jgi:hypothetical protein
MPNQATSNEHAFIEHELNEIGSIPAIVVFTIKDFFFWWYIQMPFKLGESIGRLLTFFNDQLSISLLLSTFFVPWRRDYSAVGHFMGIMVRIVYLPIAILIYVLTAILSLLTFIGWLVLPLVTCFFIIATPFLKL